MTINGRGEKAYLHCTLGQKKCFLTRVLDLINPLVLSSAEDLVFLTQAELANLAKCRAKFAKFCQN